jgi:uncharacterized protein YijF (DUF1287 family)
MAFPSFWAEISTDHGSTIETDPDHPQQLFPAMTAFKNQLVCIDIVIQAVADASVKVHLTTILFIISFLRTSEIIYR